MSTAKVLSTKFITTITKGNRVVEVGYVDTTDVWNRVFLSEDVKRKFTRAAEAYIDTLRPDTSAVALQETPHKSESDYRTHFTAVEFNNSGKLTAKRHFATD